MADDNPVLTPVYWNFSEMHVSRGRFFSRRITAPGQCLRKKLLVMQAADGNGRASAQLSVEQRWTDGKIYEENDIVRRPR
jgi:hypothetical protein